MPSDFQAQFSMGRGLIACQKGFSIIELLVTLAVLAIISVWAMPHFADFIANQKIRAISSELYISLVKARSAAIKSNNSVSMAPSASGWQSGWIVTDSANNTIDQQTASGVNITGPAGNIVYLSSGRVLGSTTVTFNVASSNVSTGHTTPQCVTLTATGTPFVRTSAC